MTRKQAISRQKDEKEWRMGFGTLNVRSVTAILSHV
jgi:hypothetical protein